MKSVEQLRAEADAYEFHDIYPSVCFGTASDRYAGWKGQIYPEGTSVSYSTRSLGGQQYREAKVPIESVAYYFDHFSVLEIDFTFYRPLLEASGDPAKSSYFPLRQYARYAPDKAHFVLKAPQQYFGRTLRRGGGYIDNPDFLDADAFRTRFFEPASELLGNRLKGIIFQQEYQRVSECPSPDRNVEQLDNFFGAIPDDIPMHIELRSEHLLNPVYFEWLQTRGIGHVFSQWTWLPPIRKQWTMCGERFSERQGQVVARLLTPRNMKYAQAYSHAHPFDKPVPELADSDQAQAMILDATALVLQAGQQNAKVNLFANNRAWGNSPDLCKTIAHRILDEREKSIKSNDQQVASKS